MTISAVTGPQVVFGLANTGSTVAPAEYNEERAPSLIDLGDALMDPRPAYNYTPGQAVGHATLGLWGLSGVVDYFPTLQSTNGIAASQSATGNAPLTLTATGAGATTVSIVAPESGKVVSGLIAIDGKQVPLQFNTLSSQATIQMWNPQLAGARALTITSSVNDSGGAYTVVGRDLYGFKITETIVGPNAATVTTQKAFKYVASITSSGTINSTGVYVGISNTFGFPLRVDYPAYVSVWQGTTSSAVYVTLGTTTSHVLASTRATQTSTTPDVRGTFTSTYAFDGATVRLYMCVMPAVQNLTPLSSLSWTGQAAITSTNFSGLFGTPFSSV